MNYDFDSAISREDTSCYKYDMRKQVFGREDVIPMWIADMDFPVAPSISEAIKNRAEHAVYGYDFRSEDFYRSIIDWVEKRNGWKIEKDWIVFTPGVVAGFVFGELAFAEEGDGITIQPPVYHPFAGTIRENRRKLVNNPLVFENGGYGIDFDNLDKCLAESKIFLFCNPHNPSGRVFARWELEKIAELCIKNDVVLMSDEIHSDLVYTPHKHIHIASLNEEIASRTITFLAPSKTFNIAGLSSSVAVIPDATLRKRYLQELNRYHVAGGTPFGNIAFEAAYLHGEQWLEQLLVYLRGNANYIEQYLSQNIPSVKTYTLEGTYLMWLDFRELFTNADQLDDFLINKARLGLNNGRMFGVEGKGFARMNIATSRAIVEEAMHRLKYAVESL